MLTAIAAFAEAFVNPLGPLLALGAALLARTRWLSRLAGVAAGCMLAVLTNHEEGANELILSMLGAALALLLHTEIALQLTLPGLRWLLRCVATGWELAWLVLAMMGRLLSRARRPAAAPPEKDRVP